MSVYAVAAGADANTGEFMGYRLGDQYPVTPDTAVTQNLSGNLVILAGHPVMPADMGKVYLTTTAGTHTIGFIGASQRFATEAEARQFAKRYYELLHAKYPDWQIDAGRIRLDDRTLMPTALSFDKPPYTIRMKLISPESGPQPYRITLTLRYLFNSAERREWERLARSEQEQRGQRDQQQLLENADTRGL